jgi:hypothetical protein
MPDDLGNDMKLINEGGEIDGEGEGDGPVQIADFSNDPPEEIEGRTPQQQAADAQQAAQEAQQIAQQGSISAITPEELIAGQQQEKAREDGLFEQFDQGYFPDPGTADWYYYLQWQTAVKNGRVVPIEEEHQHPVEEF